MQRHELEQLNREELIALAERHSVPRPRVLTQPELIDEILTRTTSKRDLARARGWFGRARDLLASVVERGLHLPEVARVLRATPASRPVPTPPPPLATVTLAEIYAAQGHLDRALGVLDEVLLREPTHEAARKLHERFVEQTGRATRPAAARDVQPSLEHPDAPAEPPADTEPQPQAAGDAEPQPQAADTEPQPQAAGDTEPQPQAAGDTEPQPQAAGDTEPQPQAAGDTEPQPQAAGDTEPQPQAAGDTEPQPEAEVAQEAPSEAELQAADEAAQPSEPAVAQDRSTEEAPETSEPFEVAAEAPAEVVPEPEPLPKRYNVDEVVAIAVDPTTLYFYWEVRPTTLARLRAAKPIGALIARLISVVATWEGPLVDQRDVRIDLLYGDHTERGIPSGSHVRVSIGWVSGVDFDPIAIGAEVEVPRGLPAESVALSVGRWTPAPGGSPLGTAGDYKLNVASFAPAQGVMGVTRTVLGSAGMPSPPGALSPERVHPGAQAGLVPAVPLPQGGASELSRTGPIGAG